MDPQQAYVSVSSAYTVKQYWRPSYESDICLFPEFHSSKKNSSQIHLLAGTAKFMFFTQTAI